MRVLVISKRQYMGKDLLDDRYGRFYEVSLELARLGHEVRGVCASYRARLEGEFEARRGAAGVLWQARNVRAFSPVSMYRWLAAARLAARRFGADLIWACSDAFHAILGAHLQQHTGAPCVIDLYDNFESFPATRLPGVRPFFRSAVRHAAGVVCVSRSLERYVRETYRVHARTVVMENGISAEFRPHERLECRRRLGLPPDAEIVGTAGAIAAGRGIELLFKAFLRLAERHPKLHLLLAGPVRDVAIPRHERIKYLGELPLAEVPCVIGAMDVAVVSNKRSAFGDYCFPQKLYEIIACGVPPAVANTLGVAELLAAWPGNRYEPESERSLVETIEGLLARPALPAIAPKSWSQHAEALASFFEQVHSAWQGPAHRAYP